MTDTKPYEVLRAFPQLMTTKQCAEFLQVTPRRLETWRAKRERGEEAGPPFLHITERTLRYDRDDVLEWARSHRVA